MNAKQQSLFGPTPDQNNFQSIVWGRLTFYPAKSFKWKDTCRHCLLWIPKDKQSPFDECLIAPCSEQLRNDGLNGYFGIQSIPSN